MTSETRALMTIREAAGIVASELDVSTTVATLDPDLLFPMLRRLEQVTELAGKWKRAIEARMSQDGWVGEHWTDEDGHEYAFLRSSRGDFADPRALFADLMQAGVGALRIAEAVSKVRVTTLREMAAQITDDERRALVLDLIEEHRTKVQGAPRLTDLDSPYRKSAIAAKQGEK